MDIRLLSWNINSVRLRIETLKKVIKIYNGQMLQTSQDSVYGLPDSR